MTLTLTLTYWTVWLGAGAYSHAARDREAARTACGRRTDAAREWVAPGSEPGCHVCFDRVSRTDD